MLPRARLWRVTLYPTYCLHLQAGVRITGTQAGWCTTWLLHATNKGNKCSTVTKWNVLDLSIHKQLCHSCDFIASLHLHCCISCCGCASFSGLKSTLMCSVEFSWKQTKLFTRSVSHRVCFWGLPHKSMWSWFSFKSVEICLVYIYVFIREHSSFVPSFAGTMPYRQPSIRGTVRNHRQEGVSYHLCAIYVCIFVLEHMLVEYEIKYKQNRDLLMKTSEYCTVPLVIKNSIPSGIRITIVYIFVSVYKSHKKIKANNVSLSINTICLPCPVCGSQLQAHWFYYRYSLKNRTQIYN